MHSAAGTRLVCHSENGFPDELCSPLINCWRDGSTIVTDDGRKTKESELLYDKTKEKTSRLAETPKLSAYAFLKGFIIIYIYQSYENGVL